MATRLVKGQLREVWVASAPLDGGSSETVTTGIRIAALVEIARVTGILEVTPTVGAPVLATSLGVTNGYLTVTIDNTVAPGNTAIWTLNIVKLHSLQQALNLPNVEPAIIHVVQKQGAGVAGATTDHTTLTELSRFTIDQHTPSSAGIYQRVLANDFSSAADALENVTGMSVPVLAGESYLVDIDLTLSSGAGGSSSSFQFAVGGSATASSCLLTHKVEQYATAVPLAAAAASKPIVTAVFGDGGVIATGGIIQGKSKWEIKGVLHINGNGNVVLRAATGDGLYENAGIILLDSTMRLERIK